MAKALFGDSGKMAKLSEYSEKMAKVLFGDSEKMAKLYLNIVRKWQNVIRRQRGNGIKLSGERQ